MEQLVKVLEKLTAPSTRSLFKAPTSSHEGEVKLLIKRFQKVADENCWMDRETLPHLHEALIGSTKLFWEETIQKT